jgi:DNA-binding MurR/RpiR family transcriptional regulator
MADPRAVGALIPMRLQGGVPLATQVGVVLFSTAKTDSLPGENATGGVAQLNLLDRLFVAAAQRDRTAADLNPARSKSAVQSKRRT